MITGINCLPETYIAYIAGIIDGEGCISLYKRLGKYLTPGLTISNTNKELIDTLTLWLGGRIDLNKDPRKNRKPCFHWRCHGSTAREIIRAIKPYLIVKAKQAEIILSLPPPHNNGWPRMTEADFERNRRAIFAIKQLNRRGTEETNAA